MLETRYPEDVLGEEDDDGRMPENVAELSEAVVGQRIVSAEKGTIEGRYWGSEEALILTLDNGTQVRLSDTEDCCAYTALEQFLLHPDKVDHIITGVATTEGYTKWHIFADFGDVLELKVGWSCGNPFYYGYGFNISVVPLDE
ncbi:UNVERIFIED_ORG: hypothetical protein M2328_006101 [Rhodococcus erythropolis]